MNNPILPPAKYNATPWIVIVLEPKGSLTSEQEEPLKVPVRYDMIGESFKTPIFATTVGGEISIRNSGKDSRRLIAKSKPDLLKGDPINPNPWSHAAFWLTAVLAFTLGAYVFRRLKPEFAEVL